MANSFYSKGLEAFATKQIDWVSDTITAMLVDAADYTPNLATDVALDDVPAGARVASANLANKSASLGVLDADDTTFTQVSGDSCEYVVLYLNTGVEATSLLIGLIDTALGLPATPDGTDIVIRWDNGANKIAKL